jgi:NAD(P)-dependent dehydrogenase (short-subunit alcohol dehydrogenase family)
MAKQNKICAVTGANAGIGRAITEHLAALGYHLIMICRNEVKGTTAQQEIIQQTGNQMIDLVLGDFASLDSVHQVAEKIKQKYQNLNVLINNAGVFEWDRKETQDGYEMTMGVNYLAHFQLTYELLPLIRQSAPARIINVSSDIHKFFGINMKDIMSVKKYASQKAYSNSKTALVMMTYDLAKILENQQISVHAMHPGHVKTQMMASNNNWFMKLMEKIFNMYTPIEDAAKTALHIVNSEEGGNTSGKYWKKSQPVKSGKKTYKLELQKELRILSEEWVQNVCEDFKLSDFIKVI